ncbi:MAG: T9SS type A sorting domain-containing protein [Chitinophagales bacterium]|nr:T9SS type A sorting domain-containing protein [Chitinophagales bacterium]MDW8428077.1 T9SS type A sorting domain-containing protein [Chitinophagales bacterium]
MRILYLILFPWCTLWVGISGVVAQSLPPKQAYPFSVKQLHCGHSLTDPLFVPWPGQYVELVADLNNLLGGWQAYGNLVGRATLPGAWLKFHWDTTGTWCAQDPNINCYEENCNPRYDISLWQVLVITENMEGPLNLNVHQSKEHLSYFVQNSWTFGNNGQGAATLLWTHWGGLDGTPYFLSGYGVSEATDGSASGWRQLLDSLELGWQELQDYANANLPSGCPPVYIIPGNRMMARFYDDVQQGLVPGISHVNQIFTDGVHLNDLGAYLVAMIHYACLFNSNPVGLSHQLHSLVTVPADFAAYAQQMVWEVVTSYPRSGVYPSAVASAAAHATSLHLFPNPAGNHVVVHSPIEVSSKEPIRLFTTDGALIRTYKQHHVDLSGLAPGCYLVRHGYAKALLFKR